MHDASADIAIPDTQWPVEFADPGVKEAERLVLCHNDACLENVVFRDGHAAALIDFDFAAPGRPMWDLAMCAFYWVPMVPPEVAAVEGLDGLAGAPRLRVLADAYGLGEADRRPFLELFFQVVDVMEKFVNGRVAAGDPVFTKMDAERDPLRWSTIRSWLDAMREQFRGSLGVPR